MALNFPTSGLTFTGAQASTPMLNTLDHSVIWCIYRSSSTGSRQQLLSSPGNIVINWDDSAGTVQWSVVGSSSPNAARVLTWPSGNSSGEWTVLQHSWLKTGSAHTLNVWMQSETKAKQTNSVSRPGSTFVGPIGDFVIGNITGTVHMMVFDQVLDGTDFDNVASALFSSGNPYYALRSTTGNFTGTFVGVESATSGCVYVMDSGPIASGSSTGALPGADLTVNNLAGFNAKSSVSYSSTTARDCWMEPQEALVSVSSGIKKASLFDPDEDWSDILLPLASGVKTNYVGGSALTRSQPAPHTRAIANGTPAGQPTFVSFDENSRAVRLNAVPTYAQNWVGGFIAQFPSITTGVRMAPCTPSTNTVGNLVFTRNGSSNTAPTTSGTVNNLGDFSRLWTGTAGGSVGNGRGVILRSNNAAWSSKLYPVSGTAFNAATMPLTLELFYLIGPGLGTFTSDIYQGSANNSLGTLHESGTTVDCGATTITYSMTGSDSYTPASNILSLVDNATTQQIEVGMMVFVSSGTGVDSISEVVDITDAGATLSIELSHDFATTPTVGGSSVLKFGHYSYGRLLVDSAGLMSGGPGRGFNCVAPDGATLPVVLFSFGGWATGVTGVVPGGVGKSGDGWDEQHAQNLPSSFARMFEAIDAHAHFQFFASQNSDADSMSAEAAYVRAGNPTAEIWYCGDPDLSNDDDQIPFHEYCTEAQAATDGVGLLNAVDIVGDIFVLADLGWMQSGAHFQSASEAEAGRAIGTGAYLDELFTLAQTAALPTFNKIIRTAARNDLMVGSEEQHALVVGSKQNHAWS